MGLAEWSSRFWDVAARAIVPRRRLATVTQASHRVSDLPAALDGYTIAALADFHHRHPFDDVRWLRHAVDVTNELRPDIIVLLGDYGSSFRQAPLLSRRWYNDAMKAMSAELGRLRARDGVLAVLGNHDYYASAADVRSWLRGLGVRVLSNTVTVIDRTEGVLRVAGLDDFNEGTSSGLVEYAVGPQPPTIVLSHHPDGIGRVDPHLRVDIMIAGHTHGGQIVLPVYGAPLTMSRTCGRHTAHGWIPNPRAPLYVTRGLGEQLPLPIRVGAAPEISVLKLRATAQQPA
jgi:predicted MPP superfamily phosphohydrolase